jgi:hypothetical protein
MLGMADAIRSKATVENCTEIGAVAVSDGQAATFFHVEAKIDPPTEEHSEGIFKARLIKPEGIAYLTPPDGTHLEHERFYFDSLKELARGDKLEIEISGYPNQPQ